MSRIGGKPVALPDKVKVTVQDAGLLVEGPKGKLQTSLPKGISAEVKDGELNFARSSEDRTVRAAHGLARSLAANAVKGVSEGFEKRLEIKGVGYRAAAKGKGIQLNLGYSHQVEFTAPDGIELAVEDQTKLVVRGIDKQAVGQVAANIRALRPPDAYKGKGIRYSDEIIRLKAGKAGVK